jgi:hypothetical protein
VGGEKLLLRSIDFATASLQQFFVLGRQADPPNPAVLAFR